MDINGPFPKRMQDKQYLFVITDRYSKPTWTIQTSKTTATKVENVFMDYWLISYRISTYSVTDNETRSVNMFFTTLCTLLEGRHLATSTCHLQANGQAERLNKTIVTCLRQSIAKHQKDPDTFVQSLTYAYSTQVPRMTNRTPFSLVLSRHPP